MTARASQPRILVVDDEPVIRRGLVGRLTDAGYDAHPADSLAAARAHLAANPVDAVLLDLRLPDGDGLDLLAELATTQPALPVIIATAFGDSERTIRAMRLGAFEYVTKPFDLPALLAAVGRATDAPERTAASPADGDGDGSAPMIGSSPRMLPVWKAIGRAAAGDAPVLITGETGVGKELVARAIHQHGDRRAQPFVAINLAAIPSALIESELFGHDKGAFTGAVARRDGRFEAAAGGTLFLDEIADLDAGLQTKLLRVLEDGSYERVGSGIAMKSTARIIAATSRPVEPGAAGATMREDLYYRLAVLGIDVPPLRERQQDIPALVHAFLRHPRRAISEAALDKLIEYPWPGNVRELRHVLHRATAMSRAETIEVGDLVLRDLAPVAPSPIAGDLDLRAALDKLERQMIVEALSRAGGNRAEAARLLGIRRALLYARLRHFGMHGSDEPS